MLNRTGVAAIVFALCAAGLGFAMYFVESWLSHGELSINIERSCDWLASSDVRVCNEFDATDKRKINRYLQLAVGPGLAFLAALLTVMKLCCGKNCCVYLGAIKAICSCAAYITSTILFAHEHYWTSDERSRYSISWGIILTPIAAIHALIAAICMIVSGCKTRNQFGGRVMDAMQVKSTTRVTPRKTRPGRRV